MIQVIQIYGTIPEIKLPIPKSMMLRLTSSGNVRIIQLVIEIKYNFVTKKKLNLPITLHTKFAWEELRAKVRYILRSTRPSMASLKYCTILS